MPIVERFAFPSTTIAREIRWFKSKGERFSKPNCIHDPIFVAYLRMSRHFLPLSHFITYRKSDTRSTNSLCNLSLVFSEFFFFQTYLVWKNNPSLNLPPIRESQSAPNMLQHNKNRFFSTTYNSVFNARPLGKGRSKTKQNFVCIWATVVSIRDNW